MEHNPQDQIISGTDLNRFDVKYFRIQDAGADPQMAAEREKEDNPLVFARIERTYTKDELQGLTEDEQVINAKNEGKKAKAN